MPIFTHAQSGYNVAPNQYLNRRSLSPGDMVYSLFDGSETPANGLASVAIARGPSRAGGTANTTFYASGLPSGCTVDIEAANVDVDAQYSSLATIGADANGNGYYTDSGTPKFYRAKISAYTSGEMPKVTVQR